VVSVAAWSTNITFDFDPTLKSARLTATNLMLQSWNGDLNLPGFFDVTPAALDLTWVASGGMGQSIDISNGKPDGVHSMQKIQWLFRGANLTGSLSVQDPSALLPFLGDDFGLDWANATASPAVIATQAISSHTSGNGE
jgi:hypothetical protein